MRVASPYIYRSPAYSGGGDLRCVWGGAEGKESGGRNLEAVLEFCLPHRAREWRSHGGVCTFDPAEAEDT